MKKTKKTKISSDKIKLIITNSDIFLYYEIEFIINKFNKNNLYYSFL